MISIEAVEIGPEADGCARVSVRAEGKTLELRAATPQGAASRPAPEGYVYGPPSVFVAALTEELIRKAVGSMAADLGGYWLRYYGSASRERGPHVPQPLVHAELTDVEGANPDASGVAHARIEDGRTFSILCSTPSRFAAAFREAGLRFYFGASVLFLERVEAAVAQRALADMASHGDRWLCLYDTPRTTLPKVLADFKSRH